MYIDIVLGAPMLFVVDGAVRFGHVAAVRVSKAGTVVMVQASDGVQYRADLEDVFAEPWQYSTLTGQWLREKLDPIGLEPEAPVSIPISTDTAHGVEIPVRTSEASDAPAVES